MIIYIIGIDSSPSFMPYRVAPAYEGRRLRGWGLLGTVDKNMRFVDYQAPITFNSKTSAVAVSPTIRAVISHLIAIGDNLSFLQQ